MSEESDHHQDAQARSRLSDLTEKYLAEEWPKLPRHDPRLARNAYDPSDALSDTLLFLSSLLSENPEAVLRLTIDDVRRKVFSRRATLRKPKGSARCARFSASLENNDDDFSAPIDRVLSEREAQPDERFQRDELAHAVGDAVAKLPDDQRKLIQMHYFEGMTDAAIARALHLSIGTVASKLSRTRQHLRGSLLPSVM